MKRWRFFADAIVDVGILAEMAAAPFAGTPWFLALLCFSSMCKALCGVSAGAANTAITQHFASGGADIGEIASKGGAVGYVSYPAAHAACTHSIARTYSAAHAACAHSLAPTYPS